MPEGLSLSATEAGLLTVAERRGVVSTPRVVDRNDTTSVERRDLLGRLVQRGLLNETSGAEAECTYAITEQGRAALAALDAMRPD
jgi:predicted transcriptional regulator